MVSRKRLITLIGVLFLVPLFIAACGGTDSGNGGTANAAPTATSAPAATPLPGHHGVGEQVAVGTTWMVTVNGVKTSKGGSFSTPDAGNIYLVVDVTVTNVSSEKQPVSSLLSFTLKDTAGKEYDESIAPDVGKPPDGDVEANNQLKGQLVYEVPTDQKLFNLTFISDLLGTDMAVWDLSA
ncbi:MAG TPA: DUF4352 domain-containing protein [Ktedonobacterales bacterium]